MPSKRDKPPITASELRELVHYEPDAGVFTWKVDRIARVPSGMERVNARAGDVIHGTVKNDGYLCVTICGRVYLMHRVAFLYMTGQWPQAMIDHKDGVKTNNVWGNLREAPRSINSENQRRPMSNNKVGMLGVTKDQRPNRTKPFRANIKADSKYHFLGSFATAEEAHQAYVVAKRQLHEGCTL